MPGIVSHVLAGPGEALDDSSRAFMEARFARDFSAVRVHHDPAAAHSARAIDAHAYAAGSHVVFGAGRYRPHEAAGRKLLAHELAHVVQQSSAPPRHEPATPAVGASDAAERDAARAADDVSCGRPATVREAGSAAIARDPTAPSSAAQAAINAIGAAALVEPALGIPRDDPVWGRLSVLWMVELLAVLEIAGHLGQLAALDRQVDQAAGGVSVRLRLAIDAVKMKRAGARSGQIDPAFLKRLEALHDENQTGEVVHFIAGPAKAIVVTEQRPPGEFDFAGPATAQPKAPARSADADVAAMTSAAKLGEAIHRAHIAGEAGRALMAMLTPEALATMAAFAAAYVVSQVTPAGWVADIIGGGLLLVSVVMIGTDVIDIVKHLMSFIDLALNAKSTRELDLAGKEFAEAVAKGGIDIVMAIVFHQAAKAARPYLRPPPPAELTMVEVTGKGVKGVPNDTFPANDNAHPYNENLRGNNVVDLAARRAATAGRPVGAGPSLFDGTSPLKIDPSWFPAEAVPEAAPAQPLPVDAPGTAAAAAATPKVPAGLVGAGAGAAAQAATNPSPQRQRQHRDAYPIFWPLVFGPPALFGAPITVFIKGTQAERDVEFQSSLRQELWKRYGQLYPKEYHAHHIVPLFLGGMEGARGNITFIPGPMHLRGHGLLNVQPQMATPPPPLRPLPPNILNPAHVPGTKYELVGFK